LLKIKTWGTKWKKSINKTNEWATWRWANAKIDKKKFCNTLKNCKHSKGGYGKLPLGNVSLAIHFFKECTTLKKSIS
jgi:hypothetical protein